VLLIPVLPTREEFPYAIRQVSEALGIKWIQHLWALFVLQHLSLLNAGVPLKCCQLQVLRWVLSSMMSMARLNTLALTDILGAEDAFGDMDFKVAGTKDFVTALTARYKA